MLATFKRRKRLFFVYRLARKHISRRNNEEISHKVIVLDLGGRVQENWGKVKGN